VIEGSRLKTGDAAEPKWNLKTAAPSASFRIAKSSSPALRSVDDGQRLSSMQLASGTAYVNYRGKKSDQFMLNFGHESVTVTEPAHFRIASRH